MRKVKRGKGGKKTFGANVHGGGGVRKESKVKAGMAKWGEKKRVKFLRKQKERNKTVDC